MTAGPARCRTDAGDDDFLFRQGSTGRLGEVRFHDWRPAFDHFEDVPSVVRFREQIEGFRELLTSCGPDADQREDLDFMLPVGRLFMTFVYGHLILEQARLTGLDRGVLDQIFALLIRDFAGPRTGLHGKPGTTDQQRKQALACLRTPAHDAEQTQDLWQGIEAIAGTYAMHP